jgi:DNA-binding transcriptional LysR family regulator
MMHTHVEVPMPNPHDGVNWDGLRYFLRAVEAGTLAGAARTLGTEHTTIGRRITALERSLGVVLVRRGPEGLQLTEVGERVVPLVEQMDRAVAAIRDVAAGKMVRVRLAVPSGFTAFFAPALAGLRRDHPELTLEIVSGARPVDLKKGEADLALRIGPVTDPELIARKIGESGWALFAAEAYLAHHPAPTDLDDLHGHEVIGYDPSFAALAPARWLEERIAGATVVLRSREMTDMVAATVSGLGLAVVPCSLADGHPALRRLSPVLGTHILSIVYRREGRLSAELRVVAQFVVDVMAVNAALFRGHPG